MMGKMKIGYLMLLVPVLVPVCVFVSACSTTNSEHTVLAITPEARRAVEAAQQAEAESEDSTPEEAAKLAFKDPDEVICRYEPAPTGTRLGKRRICATRAEWDDLSASARAETERIQGGAKHCIPTTTRPC